MKPTVAADLALGLARTEAEQLGSAEIDTEHLVIGIFKLIDLAASAAIALSPIPEAARAQVAGECAPLAGMFGSVRFDPADGRRRLREICRAAHPAPQPFSGHRSERCRVVFEAAAALGTVDLAALLRACLDAPSPLLDQLFVAMGIAREALRRALAPPTKVAPDPAAAIPTPPQASPIAKYGRDLTRLAREGKLQPAFGRRDEIKRVARILLQSKKANPLLIGDAGVGKTAIVEGLAIALADVSAPENLRATRLVEISIVALTAGTAHRGQFEERVQALIKEAESDPNLVLFVDEIHTLLAAGAPMDAANLLKPALARGLRLIGATTTAEYRKHVEKDAALVRRFQLVWIEEPTRDAAVQMLEALRSSLEAHFGLRIEPAAIARAVDLSIRYLPDLRLPDKAIDVIDQACARTLLASFTPTPPGQAAVPQVVEADVVAAVIAERCRVPLEQVTIDEAARLLHMEAFLGQRVMGQPRAIKAVADAIRTARAGLRDPRRPPGVFLFAGPTGTGKTELAKAVAEFLFGDERRLIRIDLSEYHEKHLVARLIGSPPGYFGHDEGGQLTEAIRTQPYSVVLLDEVDKAHHDVLDVLLPVLDEGHLTDGKGRRASFAEAVIIMTSNYGVAMPDEAGRTIGFAAATPRHGDTEAIQQLDQEADARVCAAVTRALRPELLNRIPNIVAFVPISRSAARAILDKLVRQVQQRLAPQHVTLALTPSAYELLLRYGVSDEFGARELERAVDRFLVQPLGQAVLRRQFGAGAIVTVTGETDRLRFEASDASTA